MQALHMQVRAYLEAFEQGGVQDIGREVVEPCDEPGDHEHHEEDARHLQHEVMVALPGHCAASPDTYTSHISEIRG